MKPAVTICQLLHSLHVGGAEVLAARLARQAPDAFRFCFLCLDELGSLGQQLRDEGFRVEVLGRRMGSVDWRLAFRLGRLLRRERVDLVHAHQYAPFFYALAARQPRSRPPILFTEHGRQFPDYPRRKRVLVNRLFLRRRDRVVGVGQAVAQALIDNEGFPPQRVSVVYNGIDLSAFNNRTEDREKIRREMGVESGDLVVLQVARLDYLKDHATAIRTLARLIPECSRARLVLVGEGPEREEIQQLADQLSVRSKLRLLGLRTDVPRLLTAADVVLLSSISEGIPLTLIEGMAAGLPVVATQVGGVSEVVEDGKTGLLAPAGDDAGLAQRILRLAGSPETRTAMGELGRQRAHARFSESRMRDDYTRLYRQMLSE